MKTSIRFVLTAAGLLGLAGCAGYAEPYPVSYGYAPPAYGYAPAYQPYAYAPGPAYYGPSVGLNFDLGRHHEGRHHDGHPAAHAGAPAPRAEPHAGTVQRAERPAGEHRGGNQRAERPRRDGFLGRYLPQ